MKGRIAPHSLDAVKARASLVDIVRQFIQLKPHGRRFIGLCPFHKEKTPSFHVNPDEGLFYCFGCQKGGDAIRFVQDINRIEFIEAIEWIAEKQGMSLEFETSSTTQNDDRLYQILEKATQWFQSQLQNQPSVQENLSARGVSKELIQTFRLGFAPDSWSGLLDHLTSLGLKTQDGVDAGLFIKSDRRGTFYSRFRNRIMIPVSDMRGRIIGLAGRWIGEEKPQNPKYLNSPETVLFKKSEVFFGGPQWEQAAIAQREIILVEGYFDAISLWEKGLRHAVAVMGLGITAHHLQWMKKKRIEPVLMLDGDEAGLRASQRLLGIFMEHEVFAREVTLPTGDDPDTWAHKQTFESIAKIIETAPLHVDVIVDRILKAGQGSLEDEIKAGQQALSILDLIREPVQREVRVKYLAERLGLDPQKLRRAKPLDARSGVKTNAPQESQPITIREKQAAGTVASPEVDLVEIIIRKPRLLGQSVLRDALVWVGDPRVLQLVEELIRDWGDQGYDSGDEEPAIREQQFLQFLSQKWHNQPQRLSWLARCRLGAGEEVVAIDQSLQFCIQRMKDQVMKKKSRESIYSMKKLQPESNWEELEKLMRQHLDQARARHGLDSEDKVKDI